jgi:hypothetical protein
VREVPAERLWVQKLKMGSGMRMKRNMGLVGNETKDYRNDQKKRKKGR